MLNLRLRRLKTMNRTRLNRLRGFTLIEVLIVVVILGILSAIVFPAYSYLHQEARAKSAATNARKVRELIQVHRNSGEYPTTPAGWPDQVYPQWFKGGSLPENSWTGRLINIQTVAGGDANVYPAVKTFDLGDQAALTAWYNTDNGHFIMRVPPQSNDQDTLDLFNMANSTDANDLNQTQR